MSKAEKKAARVQLRINHDLFARALAVLINANGGELRLDTASLPPGTFTLNWRYEGSILVLTTE